MKITINKEQRLFVLNYAGHVTCFGFDNCYRDTVAMAKRMNAVAVKSVSYVLDHFFEPTPDMIGKIECYEAYQNLLGHFAKHVASKRTWYTPGTAKHCRLQGEEGKD